MIDPENTAEMARLIEQDSLFNKNMGGLFPSGLDLSTVRTVLDVACGPGGWALEVAFAHQDMSVVGIDISKGMINYALIRASTQQRDNAQFLVMDATQPLEFEQASFDFVNTRLVEGFLKAEQWSEFMKEITRVCRREGYIRMTETINVETNSSAFACILDLFQEAWRRDGRPINVESKQGGAGERLPQLLTEAGCRVLGTKKYLLDWSWDNQGNYSLYRNFLIGFTLMKPFAVQKTKVINEAEYDKLLQQIETDMYQSDFKGVWNYQSAWGQKNA